MKTKLNNLDEEQKKQVIMQWHNQQHERSKIDIPLSSYGDILEGFILHKDVWDPSITSARYHASYLFHNNGRLFYEKKAIDMGTGSGLMAIVMAKYGAAQVIATDISPKAVVNTIENVKKYDLENKIKIFQGDLFERIETKSDCIVFNLPFFDGDASKDDYISRSMLNSGKLIHRFLDEAPNYLTPDGTIVMPSYDLAGSTNDPAIHGPKHGYSVVTTWRIDTEHSIQKGGLKIHELKFRG